MTDIVDWQGQVIDGRYVVESVLGEGGMGVVLRARHKFTGSTVAVKMLRRHLRGDLADRFLAEARAAATIGHPGIVAVTDAGTTPDGDLYLVMELLHGHPLRDLVKLGKMSIHSARQVIAPLMSALGAAHAAGFVHRDLKPENIFVTSNGTVKLLDFGIAKVLGETAGPKGHTEAGSLLGTLSYMSPEQLGDSSTVDARTDLWAVGIIIFELLTGVLPHQGATFGRLVTAIMNRPAESIGRHLPGVSLSLTTFMSRALAIEPRQRFQTAAEMSAALAVLTDTSGEHIPLSSLLLRIPAPEPSAPGAPPSPSDTPVTGPPEIAEAVAHVQRAAGLTPGASLPADRPAIPKTVAVGAAESQRHLAAERQGRGLRLIMALVGVASLAAIAVVIFLATKGGGPPPTPPVPAVITPPAVATPVALPAAPPDAAPRRAPPVDAAAVVPASAPARSDGEVCNDGCAKLAECGVTDPTCATRCAHSVMVTACMRTANDCNGAAACFLASACGAGPTGHSTCATAARCEFTCAGDDLACKCGCVKGLAPRNAVKLWLINRCAATCRGEESCMQRTCLSDLDSCEGG